MSKRAPKNKKAIPAFVTEDEERKFWAKSEASDYFDFGTAIQPVLPALKPAHEPCLDKSR